MDRVGEVKLWSLRPSDMDKKVQVTLFTVPFTVELPRKWLEVAGSSATTRKDQPSSAATTGTDAKGSSVVLFVSFHRDGKANVWDLASVDLTSGTPATPLTSIALLESYPNGQLGAWFHCVDEDRFLCSVFTQKVYNPTRGGYDGTNRLLLLVTTSRSSPKTTPQVATLGTIPDKLGTKFERILNTQCYLMYGANGVALVDLDSQPPTKVWDVALTGDVGAVSELRIVNVADGRARVAIGFDSGAVILYSFELPQRAE